MANRQCATGNISRSHEQAEIPYIHPPWHLGHSWNHAMQTQEIKSPCLQTEAYPVTKEVSFSLSTTCEFTLCRYMRGIVVSIQCATPGSLNTHVSCLFCAGTNFYDVAEETNQTKLSMIIILEDRYSERCRPYTTSRKCRTSCSVDIYYGMCIS